MLTSKVLSGEKNWEVLRGDSLEVLPHLPQESFDLAFADPPFNINFHYDLYDDNRPREQYLKFTEAWAKAVRRVLKPCASLFVAIGDDYAAEVKCVLDSCGFHLRNWIIWHYTFGVSCTRKFNRSHTHILYYVMDPERFTFDADAIRVPSARQTTYADKRANKGGKLPDDTWVLRPQEDGSHFTGEDDCWYFPRVCGTFKERTGHPCQMPEAILDRIVRVASRPGDLVLDPFAGSGTTLASAVRNGRRAVGVELSEDYCRMIEGRMHAAG